MESGQPVDNCSTNSTCTKLPVIIPTKLRKESETYILSVLSIRCIVLGLLPVLILVFLNSKIYKDVQDRRARNIPQLSSSVSIHREHGISTGGLEVTRPTETSTTQRYVKYFRKSCYSSKNATRDDVATEEHIPLRCVLNGTLKRVFYVSKFWELVLCRLKWIFNLSCL